MTSRERLAATLNHQPVDRLCVDFGAGFQTGMGAGAVHRLRQAVLGQPDHRVKVIESYQMLGEIDEELRQALGLDVVGVHGPGTMFGFKNEGWKPFTMFDGTPVLVPENSTSRPRTDGGWLIYPEGDTDRAALRVDAKGWLFFRRARPPAAARRVEARPRRQLRGDGRRQRRRRAAFREDWRGTTTRPPATAFT